MVIVNLREAKHHSSRLLARVEAGEEHVIAWAVSPVEQPARRVLGRWGGQASIAEDFDAKLPELNRLFEGA
ncbi:MAG: hypothetical protein RL199_871 [Pseudomonadota bacterium]|jgi:antitoxin (DNA-binding transcriptional repressor) of toxin-antitoxin stability system